MVFVTDFGTNGAAANAVIHFTGVAMIPMLVHEISLGRCKSAKLVADRVLFLLNRSLDYSILQSMNKTRHEARRLP